MHLCFQLLKPVVIHYMILQLGSCRPRILNSKPVIEYTVILLIKKNKQLHAWSTIISYRSSNGEFVNKANRSRKGRKLEETSRGLDSGGRGDG